MHFVPTCLSRGKYVVFPSEMGFCSTSVDLIQYPYLNYKKKKAVVNEVDSSGTPSLQSKSLTLSPLLCLKEPRGGQRFDDELILEGVFRECLMTDPCFFSTIN